MASTDVVAPCPHAAASVLSRQAFRGVCNEHVEPAGQIHNGTIRAIDACLPRFAARTHVHTNTQSDMRAGPRTCNMGDLNDILSTHAYELAHLAHLVRCGMSEHPQPPPVLEAQHRCAFDCALTHLH